MHANAGDWLIVKGRTEGRADHHAEILAVRAGGEPPFTVRWKDDGHESVVFPGPDSEVISAARQAEFDRAHGEPIA